MKNGMRKVAKEEVKGHEKRMHDVNKGVKHMDMRGAGAATKGKKFVSQINLENNTKFRTGWTP